jgi:4-alpha-glucanotransferase
MLSAVQARRFFEQIETMDNISERAAQWGIETEYRDAFGRQRTAEPQVLSRVIDIFAADGEPGRRFSPRTAVLRRGRETQIHLEAPAGSPVRWKIWAAEPIAEGEGVSPLVPLPADLPLGTFSLDLTVQLPDGEQQEKAVLLVAPERAYQGKEAAPHRLWGLAVQLYGVRSQHNWGHGDFTDLSHLIDLAADCGAASIGLNPLHALFDDRADEASPYSPNSRLFLNPLYIDLEAIPEFPGLDAAGLAQAVEKLRRQDLVDYAGVARAKTQALRLAYDAFRRNDNGKRQSEFEAFRRDRGPVLTRFAAFELLRRRYPGPWWDWPTEWRDPSEGALRGLQRSDGEEIAFFEFVQWIAHEQLLACRDRARSRGMPIGLYLDVAVGVRPEGFDAWSEQDAILCALTVGAPPDALNTGGQNWGLAGINPLGLEKRRFEPFRRMLDASMRYAGAIRLDHVLGLKRLFLIPKGVDSDQGVYVRLPFEPLLAVTAQESVENECIVIGEDLGTIPENFRETLGDWGIWSYQVMLFERDEQGRFLPPPSYRENALVGFTTHDLPTFAGWITYEDLHVKRQLNIDPGETDEDRNKAIHALGAALQASQVKPTDFSLVAKYLAATPSRLLMVTLEDVLVVKDQPNLPGTVDQHPNWRRRMPVFLEEMQSSSTLSAVAEVMAAQGRNRR